MAEAEGRAGGDDYFTQYEREMEEASKRLREGFRLDLEAQEREIWSCQPGDLLEQIAPLDLWATGDDAPTVIQPEGQIYRVGERKGRYFDMHLVSGPGMKVIGVWNVSVLKYFKAMPVVDETR